MYLPHLILEPLISTPSLSLTKRIIATRMSAFHKFASRASQSDILLSAEVEARWENQACRPAAHREEVWFRVPKKYQTRVQRSIHRHPCCTSSYLPSNLPRSPTVTLQWKFVLLLVAEAEYYFQAGRHYKNPRWAWCYSSLWTGGAFLTSRHYFDSDLQTLNM